MYGVGTSCLDTGMLEDLMYAETDQTEISESPETRLQQLFLLLHAPKTLLQ